MIRLLLGAAIFAMCTATAAATTPPTETVPPFETVDGDDVPKVIAALRQHIHFAHCPNATKLVVVYLGTDARIAIMVDQRLCAIISGPAKGVRTLLKEIQGEPI